MKTLKRPMFRKGGEVGGGIMTGINRDNYANGTPRERYEEIVQKYAQPAIDPISQLLIQGGLRGMSQTGAGGTLGNLAMAFEQPTAQLFQNLQRQKDVKRETELAGLEIDLAEEERQKRIAREDLIRKEEFEQAKEIANIKARQKDMFAAQTPEEQFEVLTDLYKESSIPVIKNNAFNLAQFEVNVKTKNPNESYTQLSFEFGTDPRTKKKGYIPNWAGIPVNAITYNPSTGLAYRRLVRENNNASDFQALDPNTLKPLGD
jgi:hypothetical protein